MGVDFLVVIFHALYIEDFAGSTPGSVLHTHTLKLNEKLSISPAYMQEFLFSPTTSFVGQDPTKAIASGEQQRCFCGLNAGWVAPPQLLLRALEVCFFCSHTVGAYLVYGSYTIKCWR